MRVMWNMGAQLEKFQRRKIVSCLETMQSLPGAKLKSLDSALAEEILSIDSGTLLVITFMQIYNENEQLGQEEIQNVYIHTEKEHQEM